MASSYTTNLRLTLPVQGELASSWGNTVNDGVTNLVDAAISGTASIALTGTTYTLTSANGATDEARQMFLTFTGTPGGAATVTCPTSSKLYYVTNNTNVAVTLKTSGGTGIAVPVGVRMALYCDGTNVIDGTNYLSSLALGAALPATSGGTGQTSYAVGDLVYASTTTALSKLADVATGNALISGGVGVAPSYGKIGLTTHVSGTLPVANGGTGATTLTGLVKGSGTTAFTAATAGTDYVAPGGALGTPSSGTLINATGLPLTTGVIGTLPVANGGTGAATLTLNNVLLGNGTSALQAIAPGTNGNVLTSNGTTWTSTAAGGSSPLTIQNKSAGYTVVVGDLNTIINCTTGTFTIALTAAATLGSGFNVTIWNTGGDVITIDPAGAETIDGSSTLTLRGGEGTQIVCNGTNWQTGNKKTMRGYTENIPTGQSPTASGSLSFAIGMSAVASGSQTFAIGRFVTASGDSSLALGCDLTAASSTRASAIGSNSTAQGAKAAGAGSMALSGSYASGTDCFAAAIGNNTSTYGAQGANSIAMGSLAKATGSNSIALMSASIASNTNTTAIGNGTQATGIGSVAIGRNSLSAQTGKYAYAYDFFSTVGDSQKGLMVLRASTTGTTATVLTSDAAAGAATNQIVLPNNSAFVFSGIIIARQSAAGGTAIAAWQVQGAIRREGTAATTTLVSSSITVVTNVPGWTIALTADTTNGCLAITATGAAATNIRWVATIDTSELTYA